MYSILLSYAVLYIIFIYYIIKLKKGKRLATFNDICKRNSIEKMELQLVFHGTKLISN